MDKRGYVVLSEMLGYIVQLAYNVIINSSSYLLDLQFTNGIPWIPAKRGEKGGA